MTWMAVHHSPLMKVKKSRMNHRMTRMTGHHPLLMKGLQAGGFLPKDPAALLGKCEPIWKAAQLAAPSSSFVLKENCQEDPAKYPAL
mmetsp:Transcript_10543/g.16331  ORF Transcript_10543/g.16331 Transcript_10543/m.16331 type:complete len:87 (-) Transcript_10543:201-461(-)